MQESKAGISKFWIGDFGLGIERKKRGIDSFATYWARSQEVGIKNKELQGASLYI